MRGATLLVLALASVGDALRLAVAPLRAPAVSRVSTRSTPVTMQFGKKKTVEEKLEEKGSGRLRVQAEAAYEVAARKAGTRGQGVHHVRARCQRFRPSRTQDVPE